MVPTAVNSIYPIFPNRPKFNIAFPPTCGHTETLMSGRSVAWLARLFRVQEVVSSNLTAPTNFIKKNEVLIKIYPLSIMWIDENRRIYHR